MRNWVRFAKKKSCWVSILNFSSPLANCKSFSHFQYFQINWNPQTKRWNPAQLSLDLAFLIFVRLFASPKLSDNWNPNKCPKRSASPGIKFQIWSRSWIYNSFEIHKNFQTKSDRFKKNSKEKHNICRLYLQSYDISKSIKSVILITIYNSKWIYKLLIIIYKMYKFSRKLIETPENVNVRLCI